jgi:hypothetical protein
MEHLGEGRRRRGADLEEMLGAKVQYRAEAEIPLIFSLQAIDVLKLIGEGAFPVEGNLAVT